MGSRQMRLTSPCPACHEKTIEYTLTDLDVPYFGDLLQTVFICTTCGFRHSDVIHGKTHAPCRWTYQTSSEADMSVRVVRSTSGTVKIPELGVLIEPGPASEAFVTNIEGILDRVEAVIMQVLRDADTPEERTACQERLDLFHDARAGRFPITLTLEDPYGNSLIVHDKAVMQPLTAAEAAQLPRGEVSFDVSELLPEGNGAASDKH